MAIGRFMLVLHSHMPYVLSHGKSPHGTDWLFESAAECYLPLLDALDRLRAQGIKPRWTINVTPILAEQLDDPAFKDGFEDYCQEKVAYAKMDRERFAADGDLRMEGLSAMWARIYSRELRQFKEKWGRSINDAWRQFQDDGLVELITCGATHGYFPLLRTDESVQAQVRLAVETHTARFGKKPRGIWLPECAYRPSYEWKPPTGDAPPFPRAGVEQILGESEIGYFFVDSHMIRGGEPLGTYWQKFPQLAELFARTRHLFNPPVEARSEYEHYAIPGGTNIFARDPQTTVKVWSGDVGYPGDEWYLEFHKQLYPGRHRYWRISPNKQDLGAKQPYDPWVAFDHIEAHSKDFVRLVKSTLAGYRGASDRDGTVVAMYDTELFGHWWWEGPEFLYQVALEMARDGEVRPCSGGDVVDEDPARHVIDLPEGSWGEGGYHSVWLNDDNFWTWKRLYPAELKLREMAQSYGDGPAREIAEQCARELLLAEASDWQFLISTWAARDYAEARFTDHIDRFERLAGMAERVHYGGRLSDEETEFLAECRQKDAPFPDLRLDHWKKRPVPTEPTPA
ncbi:MAG: DUF1957 domain-containing protein [Armatimonadetes bacterium]|nr:DUF1957 domain-containing protein [Armatimonadota bacterium]